jgi:hypothetical protein
MHVATSLAIVFVVLHPKPVGVQVVLRFPAMNRHGSVSMMSLVTDSGSSAEQLDGGHLPQARLGLILLV